MTTQHAIIGGIMDDEYERAIEHTRRQLALLRECPQAQFIPGIPETPEQRYMRRLRDAGVFVGLT